MSSRDCAAGYQGELCMEGNHTVNMSIEIVLNSLTRLMCIL